MAGQPKLLRSDERPPFVARAFDVVTFRPRRAQLVRGGARVAVALIAAGSIALVPSQASWIYVLTGVAAAISLIHGIHELTSRIELDSERARFTSLFVTREVLWRDVQDVNTWADLPLRERQLPGTSILAVFAGTATVIALLWSESVRDLGIGAQPALWTLLFAWHSVVVGLRLRGSRTLATVWFTGANGEARSVFRIQLMPRPFVSLRRHLRRSALEHGITLPW